MSSPATDRCASTASRAMNSRMISGQDRIAAVQRKASSRALAGDMAVLTLGQSFDDESAKPRTPAQPRPAPPAGPAPGRKPRRTARLCATVRG